MSSTTEWLISALELFVVFILSVLTLWYVYYRRCYTYWAKKKVPTQPPTFPSGNLGSLFKEHSVFLRMQELYHQFKEQGHKFGGVYFFNGPVFLPIDPELVKRIIVSDFDHFIDRGMYLNEEKLPLTNHIFSMTGEQWRHIRVKMTPTFTSGKMKSMYNILLKISENLVDVVEQAAISGKVLDMKEILMRFTTDVIGSTAFGIDCNSLHYPETEFAQMTRSIFNPPKWRFYKVLLEEGLQNPGNIIKIAEDDKKLEKYFFGVMKETVEYRDKNNIQRDDFLNMLMNLRDNAGMPFNEIVSQAFLFFTAGFETSSSTMSNCLHELSLQQDLQDKVREEIHQNLGRDPKKYSYDDLLALPLLDRVIKETLRKHPALPMLNRICVKPYQIPGTDVVIEAGTPVLIPTLALHRDPDYFPNPLDFNPDRFKPENSLVPFTYLPFGDGPRNCIGLRFGLMQTKLGLATVLNNYKFLSLPGTPKELPIDPRTTVVVLGIVGGVDLKIVKV